MQSINLETMKNRIKSSKSFKKWQKVFLRVKSMNRQALRCKLEALKNGRHWQALLFRRRAIKAALIFSGIFLVIRICSWYPLAKTWLTSDWNFWDPLLSAVTLLTTLFVWFGESNEDWEEQLKMRLTVFFTYKGKLLMLGESFPLINVSDIRALAQQIGSQMADRSQLDMNLFAMNVTQDAPQSEGGEWYKDYFLTIELNSLPCKDPRNKDKDGVWLNFSGHFRTHNYRYWSLNSKEATWHNLDKKDHISPKVLKHGNHYFDIPNNANSEAVAIW